MSPEGVNFLPQSFKEMTRQGELPGSEKQERAVGSWHLSGFLLATCSSSPPPPTQGKLGFFHQPLFPTGDRRPPYF